MEPTELTESQCDDFAIWATGDSSDDDCMGTCEEGPAPQPLDVFSVITKCDELARSRSSLFSDRRCCRMVTYIPCRIDERSPCWGKSPPSFFSVRARICHPLQLVSRSATALAKRIPGPHARPGELRDGAIESLDQCGDACVLYLEQKVAHLKWHGQIRWISQCVQHQMSWHFR
jgi:hypothetical protein